MEKIPVVLLTIGLSVLLVYSFTHDISYNPSQGEKKLASNTKESTQKSSLRQIIERADAKVVSSATPTPNTAAVNIVVSTPTPTLTISNQSSLDITPTSTSTQSILSTTTPIVVEPTKNPIPTAAAPAASPTFMVATPTPPPTIQQVVEQVVDEVKDNNGKKKKLKLDLDGDDN